MEGWHRNLPATLGSNAAKLIQAPLELTLPGSLTSGSFGDSFNKVGFTKHG